MYQLKYYPNLNAVTGSINATILMSQLEYWFSKNNVNSFYKFLEPCEDSHYRKGDSWIEELGFTKAEFRGAFAKIGKVYKSKKEYDISTDKFEGKFYLSYYDRVKRLTYYLRHDAIVERIELKGNLIEDIDELIEDINELVEDTNEVLHKSTEWTSTDKQSELPISVDYNQSLLQEKDLSMTGQWEQTPYEQIVEDFNKTCTQLTPIKVLSSKRKQALDKLWHTVEGSIETIKDVFRSIQANDFLSGRIVGKMWRATFDWIIRQDKFVDIWEGRYVDRRGCRDYREKMGKMEAGWVEVQLSDKESDTNGQNPDRKKANLSVDKWQPKLRKKRFNCMMTHDWDYTLLEQMEQEYIEHKLEAHLK